MNEFRLKSDEMMFFVDFNNTLVDYANEFDMPNYYFNNQIFDNPFRTRTILAKTLIEFEQKTGITPVICVITNAKLGSIDNNGYPGIHNDLFKTFFYEHNATNIHPISEVKRFFKYLIYNENDTFFRIHPNGKTYNDIFEQVAFNSSALDIRYISQFKKKESVDRIMSVVDPRKNTSKYILFAGDSIKDDYPMKEIWTPEGVSKVFIRPGRSQKLTYAVMREFCEAKGDIFSSRNPKNGKKIICTDDYSFNLLSPEEQAKILNYHSGDYVYLTQKNSAGLIDGIKMTADLIVGAGGNQKQMI